jgi:hypothetical protein
MYSSVITYSKANVIDSDCMHVHNESTLMDSDYMQIHANTCMQKRLYLNVIMLKSMESSTAAS